MFNVQRFDSSDENVSKYVFTKEDAVAEAVLYKYGSYEERTVICCSVMSGCPVGCSFCGSGEHFIRNLTSAEIVEQVQVIMTDKGIYPYADKINKFQIMFMSMGEPMLNFKEVKRAIELLGINHPNAELLLSTTAPKRGDYAGLNELSVKIPKIGLQFSIHESTDEARGKLIPSATRMSLKDIAVIGTDWYKATGRKPYFNYCVHSGNNSPEDARRLYYLFNPALWEATISVICEKDESVSSSVERQEVMARDFSDKLLNLEYNVRVFNPAGQDDIGGGCGQLWFVQDWMKNHKDKAHKSAGCRK